MASVDRKNPDIVLTNKEMSLMRRLSSLILRLSCISSLMQRLSSIIMCYYGMGTSVVDGEVCCIERACRREVSL